MELGLGERKLSHILLSVELEEREELWCVYECVMHEVQTSCEVSCDKAVQQASTCGETCKTIIANDVSFFITCHIFRLQCLLVISLEQCMLRE